MQNSDRKKTDKLTNAIIAKWREQKTFIRFLDGNVGNCAASNLEYVSIQAAMEHINDWVVDWDMDLTARERELVMTSEWRDGLKFTQ